MDARGAREELIRKIDAVSHQLMGTVPGIVWTTLRSIDGGRTLDAVRDRDLILETVALALDDARL